MLKIATAPKRTKPPIIEVISSFENLIKAAPIKSIANPIISKLNNKTFNLPFLFAISIIVITDLNN